MSFKLHTCNTNNNLIIGPNIHIKETSITAVTILSTYIEKKISHHNHQPKTNKNSDKEINLTDTGIEKNLLFITEKSQFLSSCSFVWNNKSLVLLKNLVTLV